jgi:uncharacterized protein
MIQTAFGAKRVFDAHTHFFDRSFLDGIGAELKPPAQASDVARRLNWEEPAADPSDTARRWAAELDRHGVDQAVSIHTLPGDLASAGRGIAAAGGRLVGYVSVNPLAAGAAERVRAAVTDHGFRGVALFPAMFRFPAAGDAVDPIYQLADELRLNVFVHCGVLKVGFRTKLGLPCPFDARLANPLDLQRPAARFPRAKFIIPHLGSGLFRELLMLADVAPNVYADTSGVAGWARYLDGAQSPAQVLRRAVDVMGADRVLFGTDSTFFPRGWRRDVFDEQVRIFREAKLSDEQAGQILGENLGRLFAQAGPD